VSKFKEVVVTTDENGSGQFEDVLVVLDRMTDIRPGTAGICDLCLTAADEIRRLRRKVNRLLLREKNND
jgi:hypothetical protein